MVSVVDIPAVPPVVNSTPEAPGARPGASPFLKQAFRDPERRILALIDRGEDILQEVIVNAFTVGELAPGTLEELAELIRQGRVEEAITSASRAAGLRIADGHAMVFNLAGQQTSEFLEDSLDVTIGFDTVNTRAVRYMQGERLRMIQGMLEDQRVVTRRALVDGIQRGLNPRAQARNFRDHMFLTNQQYTAQENFRRALHRANEGRASDALRYGLRDGRSDRSIRAVAAGRRRPFTDKEIDRMVERMGRRQRIHRSQVIARTESLRAVHSGNFEAYNQAVDEGHIFREEVVREWVTAGHGVRPSHVRLSGVKRRLDGTFPAAGGPLRYPGDPRGPASETISCRCSLATRLVPIEEQDFEVASP